MLDFGVLSGAWSLLPVDVWSGAWADVFLPQGESEPCKLLIHGVKVFVRISSVDPEATGDVKKEIFAGDNVNFTVD